MIPDVFIRLSAQTKWWDKPKGQSLEGGASLADHNGNNPRFRSGGAMEESLLDSSSHVHIQESSHRSVGVQTEGKIALLPPNTSLILGDLKQHRSKSAQDAAQYVQNSNVVSTGNLVSGDKKKSGLREKRGGGHFPFPVQSLDEARQASNPQLTVVSPPRYSQDPMIVAKKPGNPKGGHGPRGGRRARGMRVNVDDIDGSRRCSDSLSLGSSYLSAEMLAEEFSISGRSFSNKIDTKYLLGTSITDDKITQMLSFAENPSTSTLHSKVDADDLSILSSSPMR